MGCRAAVILLFALLFMGCYDSSFQSPSEEVSQKQVNSTISQLTSQYMGSRFVVDRPTIVYGVVTSSDEGGNFYNTFTVENDGAALEIMAGLSYLSNEFPLGSQVILTLEGMAIGRSRGVYQVGRMPIDPTSYFAVDYIGSMAALHAVVERFSEEITFPMPATLTISQLTDAMAGRLIRIDNLIYSPEIDDEQTEAIDDGTWSGYQRFVDSSQREIYTYTSDYASYANDAVPTSSVALTGILQYDSTGENRYIIKLRDASDCTY